MLPAILSKIDAGAEISGQKRRNFKPAVVVCSAALAVSVVTGGALYFVHSRQNTPLLPQIAKYYKPFDATQYQSVKYSGVNPPENFSKFYNGFTNAVSGTVIAQKAYRMGDTFSPRASYGMMIYTVRVDKIYRGKMSEKPGDLIAVTEWDWASPAKKGEFKNITDWRFDSVIRPREFDHLSPGTQYIFCLGDKDNTDCYPAGYGFGVFPLSYIHQLPLDLKGEELQKEYDRVRGQGIVNSDVEAEMIYKICALGIKKAFCLQ